MRPVDIDVDSKKKNFKAEDLSTPFQNAECAYVDMQMSRLADVTERIDKAEEYLTRLEKRIDWTEKNVGIWVVSSNQHVDDLYNIYFSKERALQAVEILKKRQEDDAEPNDPNPWDGDPVCLGQVLEGQAFGCEILIDRLRAKQDVFLDESANEVTGLMTSISLEEGTHLNCCPRDPECPRLLPDCSVFVCQ